MNGKLISSSIGWLKKSVSELENLAIAEEAAKLNSKRKEARSQSVFQAPATYAKSLLEWGPQKSLDRDITSEEDHSQPRSASSEQIFEEPAEVILDGDSKIMTHEDANYLITSFPARLHGSTWHLLFSTEFNGFSLSTIYRLVKEHNDDPELKSPCLLLIRDSDNHRFGAFLSESPKVADKCFGCGETFVFTLIENDMPQVFKWNANDEDEHNLFISCSPDSLSVGVDDGKFAIYLDSALNQGRSQACKTFQSEPLTPGGDFLATDVELWIFR